jgi:Spherulation-specific family 4
MPDAQLVDPNLPSNRECQPPRCLPDVAAVFEASYTEYVAPSDWTMSQLSKCRLDPSRQAYFVHSVPKDKVAEVSDAVKRVAGHVFVTDLSEGFYCSFDRSWDTFVAQMAQ